MELVADEGLWFGIFYAVVANLFVAAVVFASNFDRELLNRHVFDDG